MWCYTKCGIQRARGAGLLSLGGALFPRLPLWGSKLKQSPFFRGLLIGTHGRPAGMTKEADECSCKIDQALLSTDWSKLDSLARKSRRHKLISQGTRWCWVAGRLTGSHGACPDSRG